MEIETGSHPVAQATRIRHPSAWVFSHAGITGVCPQYQHSKDLCFPMQLQLMSVRILRTSSVSLFQDIWEVPKCNLGLTSLANLSHKNRSHFLFP